MFETTASGLQFLRSQNVVHRDIKPANLLLSSKNIANAKLKIGNKSIQCAFAQATLALTFFSPPS